MTEKELTVRTVLEEVQAELVDELKSAKKNKLRKMMLEIEGLRQTLKMREEQLEEFLNEPLEIENGTDVFLLEA